MTQELATIQEVGIREAWQNEERDFTPWLVNHISELGKALSLDLQEASREAPVGPFSLDIRAHDAGRDRVVVIENQLEKTDHSHLGQLLTYAAGYDAKVAVWIAKDFKDEHREALDLLNRRTDEQTEFFGVVVEVWKIDNSRPAPHFRVVSAPNDWRKQTAAKSQALAVSERNERYRTFFHPLIDTLRDDHGFTNAKAQPQSWQQFSAGKSGLQFAASFAEGGKARVAVDVNSSSTDRNKNYFDQLLAHRESIEAELGESLDWARLDHAKMCRISAYQQGSIDDDEKTLEEIRDWMIDRLLKFKRVFGPRLAELRE